MMKMELPARRKRGSPQRRFIDAVQEAVQMIWSDCGEIKVKE